MTSSDSDDLPTVESFIEELARRCSFEFEPLPYEDMNTLGVDSLQVFEMMILAEVMADVMVPPLEQPLLFRLVDVYDYYVMCKRTELI